MTLFQRAIVIAVIGTLASGVATQHLLEAPLPGTLEINPSLHIAGMGGVTLDLSARIALR